MNIMILDISGKVPKYDKALFDAMLDLSKSDTVCILTPYFSLCNQSLSFRLFRFVPLSKASVKCYFKRLIKSLEVLLNYLKCCYYIKTRDIDVLHLQWLPFVEINQIELYILKLYKRLNKDLKIILTVHNVFPHNYSDSARAKYIRRFNNVSKFINHFIVHTHSSWEEFISTFRVMPENVTVINHGVFVPEEVPLRKRADETCRLLMFGYQELYKGTDLFVNAAKILRANRDKSVEFRIIGKMSTEIIEILKDPSVGENRIIYWRDEYISDSELYQEIIDSDVLVYPYRRISQSGALLLGVYFQKPIVLSDLPSFKETMKNYPDNLFFRAGDVDGLCHAIHNCINMDNNQKIVINNILNQIRNNNSWKVAGVKSLQLYHAVNI